MLKLKKAKAKTGRLDDEKGMALILVVFLSIILLIAVSGLLLRFSYSNRSSEKILKNNKAFYLAESGIQQALAQLRQQPYILTDITSAVHNVGSYKVTLSEIQQAPRHVLVVSSGAVSGPMDLTKTIKAVIETDNPGDFFIACSGDIGIGSGAQISGAIYADNIEFDTDLGGGQIKVSTTTYVKSTNYADANSVDPNHVVIDSQSRQPDQGITKTLPIIDVQSYEKKAKTDNGSGDSKVDSHELSSMVKGGVLLPPSNGTNLYYCKDDLYIPKNVKIDGRIAFVSEKNIIFEGSVLYKNPGDAAGFFSNKDVVVAATAPDNVEINGQIIAPNGEFRADPDPSGHTKNKFTFNGGMVIKNSGAIYGIYNQRTYNFDANLRTNPFGDLLPSYMASIVSWDEK